MFTADMARMTDDSSFDNEIGQLVKEAYPARRSFYKVWWDDCAGLGKSMSARADEVAIALKTRGFEVIAVRDLDSFRYAEVHFSWEKR